MPATEKRIKHVEALAKLTKKWDRGEGFCDCVAVINADYEERGLPYAVANGLDIETEEQFVVIKLVRTDELRKVITVDLTANYCPFCGRKYVRSEQEESEVNV